MKKYGFTIMRAQPFHLGHKTIIERIQSDGRVPIVLLGSINEAQTLRNPLSFEERKELIRNEFPGIRVLGVPDSQNWDTWRSHIIAVVPKDIPMYYAHQDEDLQDFTCSGISYKNAHYVDALPHKKHKVPIDIEVHARHIREDIEAHKHHLSDSTYSALKDLGW